MNKILKLDRKVFLGSIAIMFVALLWSIDGIFIRPQFYQFPAAIIVFLEHFIGFIFLSPFLFIYFKRIKLLGIKDWSSILWVSIFGGFLGTLFITKAFFSAFAGEISFSTVIILQKLQPVFALMLARIVLKEKLTKTFYIFSVIAIASAYFLVSGNFKIDIGSIDIFNSAAVFALIAAFAFGSSTVFGKRIVNHLDFKAVAALRFAVTAIISIIFIISFGNILEIGNLGRTHWWLLLLIVFTSGAVSMFIYYFGLKRVSASSATILELFWPISAVAIDYIFRKNVLNTTEIISSLILLICFFIIIKKGKVKSLEFEAHVTSGEGTGIKLGFPTINLDKPTLDMNHGVYVVTAKIDGKLYKSLLHFGQKETFNKKASLELYIPEHILNIGQKCVKIKIIKRIRDIKKFSSAEELKSQINEDLEIFSNS